MVGSRVRAASMRPAVAAAPAEDLRRFSLAERVVHWTLAVLMLVCIATAAILYNGTLGIAVGHRRLVELCHVSCGFALPVPMLAGLGFASYRTDLSRFNRFTPSDWTWLRSRTRRDGSIRVGKFNAGQKLNATLTAGSIVVLLGSGLLMFFPDLARLSWRTGATLVHDWFALGLGLLVCGHIAQAISDPEARRGMRTGRVSRGWALEQHGEWADEALAELNHAQDGSAPS
jgi:formate dehydrogenase subunit gamma